MHRKESSTPFANYAIFPLRRMSRVSLNYFKTFFAFILDVCRGTRNENRLQVAKRKTQTNEHARHRLIFNSFLRKSRLDLCF